MHIVQEIERAIEALTRLKSLGLDRHCNSWVPAFQRIPPPVVLITRLRALWTTRKTAALSRR